MRSLNHHRVIHKYLSNSRFATQVRNNRAYSTNGYILFSHQTDEADGEYTWDGETFLKTGEVNLYLVEQMQQYVLQTTDDVSFTTSRKNLSKMLNQSTKYKYISINNTPTIYTIELKDTITKDTINLNATPFKHTIRALKDHDTLAFFTHNKTNEPIGISTPTATVVMMPIIH